MLALAPEDSALVERMLRQAAQQIGVEGYQRDEAMQLVVGGACDVQR